MTTSIEWTWVQDGKGGRKKGETWNPQVGCREISPGCRECYAAKQAHRGMSKQHHGLTVMRTNAAGENLGAHWNGQINRVPHLLAQPLKWREPRGIFVCSMSDLFFDVDSDDACRWIAAIFGVMAACPQHTFMVLTKRPENAARWFTWLERESRIECAGVARLCVAAAVLAIERSVPVVRERVRKAAETRIAWPLPNVWVGVTAEDQQRADERVPVLLGLPAAVRFVSYEPALGPVDWTRINWPGRWPVDVLRGGSWDVDPAAGFVQHSDMPTLDWLICGGESGPHARPMHSDWTRSARDQCEAAGVAFFFKQWGEHVRPSQMPEDTWSRLDASESGLGNTDDPVRVGKAAAGRELDGRTHDAFPGAK